MSSNRPDISHLHSVKIDNLDRSVREDDLRNAFEKFGEIGDVYMPSYPSLLLVFFFVPLPESPAPVINEPVAGSGRQSIYRDTMDPRGYGFVRFIVEKDAMDAIDEMDGQRFLGKEITCQLAKYTRRDPPPRRPRRDDDYGRYRDYDRGRDRDYDRGYDRRYDRDRDYDRGRDRDYDRGRDRDYDRGRDRDYDRGRDRDYDRDDRSHRRSSRDYRSRSRSPHSSSRRDDDRSSRHRD
eukprot:gene1531-4681_t